MGSLWQLIADNLGFLCVCTGIAVLVFLLAKLAERLLPAGHAVSPARRVSIIGICAALATILYMLDFPLLFLAPEFYKLDFSEIPVMLCGFFLGPSAAVACEGVKILLKILFKGTTTAFVGDLANFCVGCAFVLPAVIVYHIHKSRRSALLGLILGTAALTVFGSAFNAIYLLPKFSQLYGIPLEAIIGMGTAINGNVNSVSTFVMLCVAPLNLIKGIAVSALTLLLYKKVARPLFGSRK